MVDEIKGSEGKSGSDGGSYKELVKPIPEREFQPQAVRVFPQIAHDLVDQHLSMTRMKDIASATRNSREAMGRARADVTILRAFGQEVLLLATREERARRSADDTVEPIDFARDFRPINDMTQKEGFAAIAQAYEEAGINMRKLNSEIANASSGAEQNELRTKGASTIGEFRQLSRFFEDYFPEQAELQIEADQRVSRR